MLRLKDKISIVTGSAQGIGSAIAMRLAQSGSKVILVDLHSDLLKKIENQIHLQGGVARSIQADITKKNEIQNVIYDAKQKFSRVDVLVNNAGMIRDGFIGNLSEEDWDRVLEVNLKGAFLFCQAIFPVMKEQLYGKVINIASRAWLGNIGQVNYSASKGGLVSLTRTLALEWARFHINVNGVAPGLIDTPMTQSMPEKARERLLKMQPTGKMGTPQDIAAAVEFLSSDDASFITGQILHVDGGKSCGLLSLG